MKPAASLRGALQRSERGSAAVELAVILMATLVLAPAVALFAKVFFQYSVIRAASQDAGAYLATLSPAAIKDPAELARAFGVAQQMIDTATVGAGLTGSSRVAAPAILCADPLIQTCFNEVPEAFVVSVTLKIDDTAFNGLTGAWTSEGDHIWQLTAVSTVPFSK